MESQKVGARVKRIEDARLVCGKGQFVDDIHFPGMLHAAFVRSSHAHAKIRAIDSTRAKGAAGVHAIFTAADMPPNMRERRMPLRVFNPSSSELLTQYCLARDEVCFVGEPIAIVIADSRPLAEDAAALVEIDFDVLPAIVDFRGAVAANAPRSRLSGENLAHFVVGYGNPKSVFQTAPHVFRESLWQHRGGGHAIECRAVLAWHEPISDMLTVWSSTQMPHSARQSLSELLGRGEETIRVIAPDVGGGFGPKQVFYAEEAVVPAAALKLQRPIKWVEDRREHFMTAVQERDQQWDIKVATDRQGKLLAVCGAVTVDGGAYAPWGIVTPFITAATVPGPYVLPAYELKVAVCFTNKVPTAPVRGAGRPQAVFAMERLMDRVARELAIDRAEVRRLNLIRPDQMPYPVGLVFRDGKPMVYDSGDYPAVQAQALEIAKYRDFEERRISARSEGRFIGIGVASYVEGTGLGPFEGTTVRILRDGKIIVRSGAASQGQGHKTMLAQICAEQFGVAIEDIDVSIGDTAVVPMGVGTFASRMAVTAGSSAHVAANAVRMKVLRLAARILKVEPSELLLDNGRVEIKTGNRRGIDFGELAQLSRGMPGSALEPGEDPGLENTAYFAPSQATYCNGTHVAEVEVDIGTGQVHILNYVVAHDSGVLINPLIVDGQIQGGVAHGIGNALFEWMTFDESAQPVTINLGDYLLPICTDVPTVKIAHEQTPSPLNPLGVKGAGEGGTIPAAAAIISAIEDALCSFGVHVTSTPIMPEHIVQLLKERRAYEE